MVLNFIPSLLSADYASFLAKLSIVVALWLIVVIASLVDLKTGIAASKRQGKFKTTSSGLRQTVRKLFEYIALLIIALLFDFVFSYLTTLMDVVPLFKLFSIPLFTLIAIIGILIIEGISVRENLAKGRCKEIIPPEIFNQALEIVSALGNDKVKAVAEILKDKNHD